MSNLSTPPKMLGLLAFHAGLLTLSSCILTAALQTTAMAQAPLHSVNDRFGFSADLPAGFQAQNPPANDDGSRFELERAVITASAIRNEAGDTMASFAALSIAACVDQQPSYLDIHAAWAVLSCPVPVGRLLYQRSALRGPAADGVFTTVRMTDPARDRERWDAVAVAVTRSMKPAPGG